MANLWEGCEPFKLQCNHCGLIIESGLFSIGNHISNECEAIELIKVNETISYRKMPVPSFSAIKLDNQINKKQ